jgi:hypothetical protein
VPRRGCLLLAAAVLGLAPGLAHADPAPPASDPFYAAPASLASAAPGDVLRSRQVDVQLGAVPLTGQQYHAYQLLYRTNDAHGQAVANATTVIVPDGAAPAGGRDLVSVDDAEDSDDSTCAPSYQLQEGEPDNHNLQAEMHIAATQLALGRELVVPDAEGPQSEYIVTGMEGHATLDSIRAAERFAPAQLSGVRTPVALFGYSGGAHVTAAAGELQPSYAPELNVVGLAAGGVPVGNRETIDYLDGSVGAGVLMATAIAIDRAYPEMRLESRLNAAGKAYAEQASKGCASSVFAKPFAHFSDWTIDPHPFDDPVVARIVADNALGHATPTAPTFFYNGEHDELITIKALDELVARYCAGGATLDYFRDPAGVEHIQGVADFTPLALQYLNDRFNGVPAPTTCMPAPAAGAEQSPSAAAPACRGARTVALRRRRHAGLTPRRIVVSAGGRVVRVARRARMLHLRLPARRTVRVDVRVTGRRHGRTVTLHERHTYHLC